MEKESRVAKTFLAYKGQLVKAIRGIVRSDDIEDIVQETFVKSFEAELKQEIKYERTYMLRTARNLALNHVAKASEKFNDSLEELSGLPPHLTSKNLEKQVESKERFLNFCRATDTLSVEVKRVFLLKKVYGLSQKEIADYLGLSQSTIEKHVAKGLQQCSAYLTSLSQKSEDNMVESAPGLRTGTLGQRQFKK